MYKILPNTFWYKAILMEINLKENALLKKSNNLYEINLVW